MNLELSSKVQSEQDLKFSQKNDSANSLFTKELQDKISKLESRNEELERETQNEKEQNRLNGNYTFPPPSCLSFFRQPP